MTIKERRNEPGSDQELKKQLKECKKKTEELEARREEADEAASLAFGAATDSQKKLIWKILTRLSTLKVGCSGATDADPEYNAQID